MSLSPGLRRAFWRGIAWPNRLAPVRSAKRALSGQLVSLAIRNMVVEYHDEPASPSGQPATAPGDGRGGHRPFEVTVSYLGWQVGRVGVYPMWKHLGLDGWWLSGVWVHPAVRGMGLGARLVSRAEQEAARVGIVVLWLNVAPDNDTAIALYRKLGYGIPEDASLRRAIEQNNRRVGNPVEQLVLRKRLTMA